MIKRTIKQIAAMLPDAHIAELTEDVHICGVSTDSRTIQAGNLFIPLIGDQFDGHTYVHSAFEQGAAAALWQKDHHDPPRDIPLIIVEDTLTALQQIAHAYRKQLPVRVVAITGSNGKTTTKDITASILATTYRTVKTEGNLNNHIGLPLTLLQLDEHTEMAVLELGMSGLGEIALLSKLAEPEVAVITNIGEAHLLQLGSREQIAKAKLEICQGLSAEGLVIFNGDEPLLHDGIDQLAAQVAKTFSFGNSSDNDLYPIGIMSDGKGCFFTTNLQLSPSYYLPLLGQHNVINALAALAVSKYMGVLEPDIIKGLKTVQTSGMRVELLKGSNGLTILNDAYNSSPTSLKASLSLLAELKGFRQKIVVIGDMLELGEQEQQLHRDIGEYLSPEEFDYIFTFGELAAVVAEAAKARFAEDRVRSLQTKQEIAAQILQLSNTEDVVLVKGSRGMKLEEIVVELQQDLNRLEDGR